MSDRLARQGHAIAPVTVWRVLRRVGLNHRLARLAVLEEHSAATGLLTERTVRRRRRGRHVVAERPGDLCSLDSFYIGKLKGVGKVWQLTACDCASSYGWARIVVGEVTAALMAAFLVEVVLPGYRAAGWQLRRVLTDNGKEFKAGFVSASAVHQVTHTRTKPRHAWTNGFVERLQEHRRPPRTAQSCGYRNPDTRVSTLPLRRLRAERPPWHLRVRSSGRVVSGSAEDLAEAVSDASRETSTTGKQREASEDLLRRMNSPRRLPASVVWFRASSMFREVSVGTLNPAPAAPRPIHTREPR